MPSEHQKRLKTLQAYLIEKNLDTMIISDPAAIAYYIGVKFDPMERLWLLLVPQEGPSQVIANELFVLDDLQVDDLSITWVKDTHTISQAFQSLVYPLDQEKHLQVGIDKNWRAGQFLPIAADYPNATFTLASDIVDQQRAIKTIEEQKAMRLASEINDRAMGRLIQEVLPLGLSELEAVDRLKTIYAQEGADSGFSFDPIIAYGGNGADPHHEPDHSKPLPGDAIVIDIGCQHQGYCSDMTRTVYYGEVSDLDRKLYNLAKQANQAGIEAVICGQPLSSVDQASRNVIAKQGYDENFTHRTGHFIGQETHEAGDVSASNHTPIQAGNIFSIEPGIYLSGQTAVRIEDLVIAHEDSVEVINHYSKDLTVIPLAKTE
ncbi:M24 family metallopeptidase [Aerococcus kribbianus]|uniref:Xaa-Pro peptidase family protein n=1 Tax=Aerococcus kribbianus TaxID=2999064 RepID=A0A9X3JF52_9LACT|nr:MULTISPECIES: Xaa-Pro peptidase family protein [unclassified Aerococcus]MCZ0717258.1 Xaa-Pro peptidase family protein [Aerococcus sp. YH-aer221]MCZ0725546.1 Xaa-Pro peptidase family protein [Aerococcus sp. YH-aer222]